MFRRVFPNLIINDIISVQPMEAPVGAIFYLDVDYGNLHRKKLKLAGLKMSTAYLKS